MIRIEDLSVEYDGRKVLENVSLTVNDGEVLGLIGPSGSGKSQLLRSILMLNRPAGGKIWFGPDCITDPGVKPEKIRKRVGMVFQESGLFDHLSVVENVMCGPVHLERMPVQEAFQKAMELLRSVGLQKKAFLYPHMLSEGQKQRAAIARVLSLKPEFLLLDEPASALDPIQHGEVETVIRMLAAKGHTMIIATHEMELVRRVCTRVAYLDNHTVWEEGTPEQIFSEAGRPETRRFVRALRVLEMELLAESFDFPGMQTQLRDYAFRVALPAGIEERLLSACEELALMLLGGGGADVPVKMTLEYNQAEKVLDGIIRFGGEPFDSDDPRYFFPWPILEKRCDEIEVIHLYDEAYQNLIRIRFREKRPEA